MVMVNAIINSLETVVRSTGILKTQERNAILIITTTIIIIIIIHLTEVANAVILAVVTRSQVSLLLILASGHLSCLLMKVPGNRISQSNLLHCITAM